MTISIFMKKNFIVIIAVFLVIIVGGAIFLLKSLKEAATPESGNMETLKNAPVTESGSAGDSVIGSIKDALNAGKKMQCAYTLDAGDQKTESVVMVDGKRFRSTVITPQGNMSVVFDGDTQYMWAENSKDKTGFKMSQACLEEFKNSLPKDMPTTNNSGITTPEDITEGFDLAQNVSCRPAPMADFSIPTDITFTDQCAMMKQSLDALKNIQLPQGIELPAGISGMPGSN